MRFFHIADLHIGKQLGGIDLTEDLRHVLFGQVLGSAYEQFRPDGLIIAGDIYDRSSPSADGVQLFDEFLSRAAELSLPVYAISGNHDNPQRVSYGRRLFSTSGIFMCEPFSAETPVTVIPCGGIDIALLPYISTEMVSHCFPEEEIDGITAALDMVLSRSELPRDGRPCLLVAHQAVARDGISPIGALEAVDHRIFERFTYTALGHFHTPKNTGADNIRYCGSPLCYSAKEAQHPQKYIDIIDISEDGSTQVTHHPISPLRPVRMLSGSYDELIGENSSEDLMFITVRGENAENDAARRLMLKFPNCVSIKYENEASAMDDKACAYSEMTFDELFSSFFKTTTGQDIDPELLSAAKELFMRSEGEIC